MNSQEQEKLADALGRDPRWKLVERIVATPGFAKSARLSSLLLFVTRESLNGRMDELREQVIGERVFGRSVGYDPRDDNIVRSHASRLRQRLDTYFREEAAGEELRVTIPRGSYVPLFERVETSAAEEGLSPATDFPVRTERSETPILSQQVQGKPRTSWQTLGLFAVVVIAIGCWWFQSHERVAVASENNRPTHRLWSSMFSTTHDTLVVPADSSLVLLKSFTGHTVSLGDYASGQYLSDVHCDVACDPPLLLSLAKHRYTSLADLKFAVAVTHMPEALPNRTEIRYARDLQLEDLKEKNLILIGSRDADPWLELFQDKMNFFLNDDKTSAPLGIIDRKPAAGERSEYLYNNQGLTSSGYATIAFLPNISGTGNVLVVQGFTLADTQAAAEFITDDPDFDSLLFPASSKSAVFPHFEIVLSTKTVNGTASHPTVLAYRIY
jgi:hypothetical protein